MVDAVAIIEEVVKGYEVTQKKRATRLDQPFEKSPSILYFIAMDGPERFIKIGIASDITTRLSNIQASCPYPIRLLVAVDAAWHLERSLHRRFSDLHVMGEWFRDADDLAELVDILVVATKARAAFT